MKKLICATLVFMSATASAQDSWTGKDKLYHAIIGGAVGAGVTKATDDWRYGCAAATAVGIAKELYDARHRDRHTPSWRDAAVTAAAGCGTSIIVAPNYIGINLKF